MNPNPRALYDAEIGPMLAHIAKEAMQAGLSFAAVVDLGDGTSVAQTIATVPGASGGFNAIRSVIDQGGDVDRWLFTMIADLRRLRVPHASRAFEALGLEMRVEDRTR